MNKIAKFRKCTLSDRELISAVDKATDNMFIRNKKGDFKPPTRSIPARPNEDYDLLIGELLLRFEETLNNKTD